MATTTTSYQVSNRDGHHDFSSRSEALEFAKELAAKGWIGDTVRVRDGGRGVIEVDGRRCYVED